MFTFFQLPICWNAKSNQCFIFHLLDDFLTFDRPTECGEKTMPLLSLIFNKLNIPLSAKKTVGPTCVLEYLGIILDTVNMQARLPEKILCVLQASFKPFLINALVREKS